MELWKTLRKTLVLERGRFLKVEDHALQLPDGQTIWVWPWVITPNFINVVLVTTDGQFVCFRQTKYACGHTTAVIGGYIEDAEDPLMAAQRETLEETGYQASDWQLLGEWVVDANRGCGRAFGYLATGATRIQAPNADDLEEQEIILLSRQEVEQALFDNAFKVVPWSNVLALALLRLKA